MKTKTEIFREAERLSRRGCGAKIALYEDLMFVGGLITEQERSEGGYKAHNLSERVRLYYDYENWRVNRSEFQLADRDWETPQQT